MKHILRVARFIIMVISGVTGTFLNSSIVVLNFRFWRDTAASGGYKKLLSVIGLSNILFQGILICDTICETFPCGVERHRSLFLLTLEFALIGVNIWNTAWLSMFCCLRLLNASHWLFLQIRGKFISCLSSLIVGSVLASVAIHLPLYWTTVLDYPDNATEYMNMSGYGILIDYYYRIFSLLLGFSLPFSMTYVSIGLSVATLLRHIRRMGHSDSHVTPAQLQGHHQAVRTMVTRAMMDLFFFLVTIIGTANSSFLNSHVFSFLWIIVLTYPMSQAFTLICGNPKLKSEVREFIRALWN